MQNVLDLLNASPVRSAIVIRHAQRCELTGAQSYWTCGLTAKGQEQAHEFGRKLAGRFSAYRIFHSPVKRCEQTAMALSEELGLGSVHPEKALGLSYLRASVDEGFAEADTHEDFIRAWFGGLVPQDIFMPLPEALAVQTAYLGSKFAEAEDLTLDIHITHDWNINVLREGIFGVRHEDIGWPDFLSGIALELGANGTEAMLYDGKTVLRKTV